MPARVVGERKRKEVARDEEVLVGQVERAGNIIRMRDV